MTVFERASVGFNTHEDRSNRHPQKNPFDGTPLIKCVLRLQTLFWYFSDFYGFMTSFVASFLNTASPQEPELNPMILLSLFFKHIRTSTFIVTDLVEDSLEFH